MNALTLSAIASLAVQHQSGALDLTARSQGCPSAKIRHVGEPLRSQRDPAA